MGPAEVVLQPYRAIPWAPWAPMGPMGAMGPTGPIMGPGWATAPGRGSGGGGAPHQILNKNHQAAHRLTLI